MKKGLETEIEVLRTETRACLKGPYERLSACVDVLHSQIEQAGNDEHRQAWLDAERQLFGDPAAHLQQSDEFGLHFTASSMDGPDVDFFAIAGLPDTDELNDGFWGKSNWEELIECCPSASLSEEYEVDDCPGYSDSYSTFEVSDPAEFARELRSGILSTVIG